MASDFVPTVTARGFHAGPVFGIFGAAVAAAKIMGPDAKQVHVFLQHDVDPQPLHIDAHFYATETPWGKPVINRSSR